MLHLFKLTEFLLFALSVAFIFYCVHLSYFAFDFSDEGFYLNWIANPLSYDISYTHFGFLYAPLFDLLDHNIVHLRIVNNLILYLLGWICTYVVLTRLINFTSSLQTSLIAFVMASSVMLYHASYMLMTPSYNTAIYAAIMMAVTCTILMQY